MRRLYVDTCLIIAYFHINEPNNQHQRAINFFDGIDPLDDIELCLSRFSITEFTQAYVTIHNITDEQAYKISNVLLLTQKIDKKYSFTLLKTEGKNKKYKFEDLFLDIQTFLLSTTPRPGIADVIHAAIMENNEISEIVTFNKSDFINMVNITPFEPEEINY